MCKRKGGYKKGHYDVQINGWIHKGGHYVEIKGWMQKGVL